MSDWKNPNWSSQNDDRWDAPFPQTSENSSAINVSLFFRGIIGFIVIISVNACALLLFMNLIGRDISYRNALGAAAVYVIWRVYDKVVYKKIAEQ